MRDDARFARFKQQVRWWLRFFGLNDWKVYFEYRRLRDAYAQTVHDAESRVATITLNSSAKLPFADQREDDDSARHEVLHLVLAELSALARWRFITPGQITAAEEGAIRRIERALDRTGGAKYAEAENGAPSDAVRVHEGARQGGPRDRGAFGETADADRVSAGDFPGADGAAVRDFPPV